MRFRGLFRFYKLGYVVNYWGGGKMLSLTIRFTVVLVCCILIATPIAAFDHKFGYSLVGYYAQHK